MLRSTRTLLLLVPCALAACGTDNSSTPALSIEATTFAASLGVDLANSTKTSTGLYYRDVSVGGGALVASGQQVGVRYTLWLPNGAQIESNANGAPYGVRIGTGAVIAGWDQGIPGMRVGGVRQLIIPPALGYGAAGSPPDIGSNAILVFSVQVLTAQ